MEAARFYAMLDRLLPGPACTWDVWPWPAHLHCGIFVHRVRGMPPGLYVLERNPAAHARLRASLATDFDWTRPASCPDSLPLFALAAGDFRERAEVVSCHQEIAVAAPSSLGMIADFSDSIRAAGPGGIADCSGNPASSGTCCTSKPRLRDFGHRDRLLLRRRLSRSAWPPR